MTVRACPLTAPVAQASTMRARCASAWAVFGRWAHRPRASALLAVTTKAAVGRPAASATSS
jgi:hypothetical protein